MPDELIIIGKVLRAVGLDGLCAIELFGETLKNLKLPAQVLLGAENATGHDPAIIEDTEMRPKGLVCRFKEINDSEAVEQLRNLFIFIESKELDSLSDDAFYHFELEGMNVLFDSNEVIGVVAEVHNYPSTDSLDVRKKNGELIIVPLNSDSIVKIDKQAGCIIVRKSFLEELL
jgi:16S rRNA processing protein RimM